MPRKAHVLSTPVCVLSCMAAALQALDHGAAAGVNRWDVAEFTSEEDKAKFQKLMVCPLLLLSFCTQEKHRPVAPNGAAWLPLQCSKPCCCDGSGSEADAHCGEAARGPACGTAKTPAAGHLCK